MQLITFGFWTEDCLCTQSRAIRSTFAAPRGEVRYWVKASTPALDFSSIIHLTRHYVPSLPWSFGSQSASHYSTEAELVELWVPSSTDNYCYFLFKEFGLAMRWCNHFQVHKRGQSKLSCQILIFSTKSCCIWLTGEWMFNVMGFKRAKSCWKVLDYQLLFSLWQVSNNKNTTEGKHTRRKTRYVPWVLITVSRLSTKIVWVLSVPISSILTRPCGNLEGTAEKLSELLQSTKSL